jgi:DNA (cytosine-5)-methyltransferase 1
LKYIELFCGIGGFRYGIEKTNEDDKCSTYENRRMGEWDKRGVEFYLKPVIGEGSTCVWANDIDKYACAIYRYHYGEVFEGDIRTVTDVPDHDLIVAGFPCQSFSIAGKRGGFEDTRGTLFFEIARIARLKRTKYLFLENVKGLLSHDEGNTFATIISTLDELGYDCQWQVLNSKNHGVPQNRERVFIIGHLRGTSRPKVFPIGEVDTVSDQLCTETQTERQRIRNEDNQCASALRIGGSGVQDNLVTATDSSRYGKDGSDTLINLTPENRLSRRVYSPAGNSPSLQTPSGGHHLPQITDKTSIRRLTPIECERLQGFPDNWTKYGIMNGKQVLISDTQRYKMLGNAVTTNVITDIIKRLI